MPLLFVHRKALFRPQMGHGAVSKRHLKAEMRCSKWFILDLMHSAFSPREGFLMAYQNLL